MKITALVTAQCLLIGIGIETTASAQTISLASTMDGNSYFSEDAATGSFARINAGNGDLGSVGANTGDDDGVYNIANVGNSDPGPLWGTPMDLFPREANFQVGSIGYDDTGLSDSFTGTVPIVSINLGAFWTADPARTSTEPNTPPSVMSDISDAAIGLWFFNGPGGIGFGSLDASDTITFSNGILTSINLSIPTTFSIDVFGSPVTWEGSFSITGNQLAYSINDAQSTVLGPSTLVADLNGNVDSVGTYAIPEPSSFALIGLGLGALALLRKRRRPAHS